MVGFFLALLPSEGTHDRPVAHAGSGGSPCPVGREPLFPRQDIHVLTGARAIHGALVAAPGRQDKAHPGVAIGASVGAVYAGATGTTAHDLGLLVEAATTHRPTRRHE